MAKKSFPCKQCGADLKFNPGTAALTCEYCSFENAIPQSEADIRELDFHTFLQQAGDEADAVEEQTLACDGCGATVILEENLASDECPFCGVTIVATATHAKRIKPRSLLPFKVTQTEARDCFKLWLSSRWFAPSQLKERARESRIQGMYLPHWTYDSETTSFYRGERGEDYWDTETYTARDSDGKTVTKTRRVKKTRWYSVSGTVWNRFDDVLVNASNSLPRKYVDKLEPWDLHALTPYDDSYLSGFRSEVYQVDLEEGFDQARVVMDGAIRNDVRRDIGGDHQRIHQVRTQYDAITFKHILLPVWLSAYRYHDKAYRFMINARTGEVQGERPWSWIKITLAVLGALLAIVIVVLALAMTQQ